MANPALRQRHLGPGDKLGKFDLIRQIAVGGMAELYLARTMGIEGFEKLVVVKRILPQYADNQSFVNMFLNEARLSATLHHPNIAQVYDIGVEDGDYFFSMEYIHGEDLGRLVVTAAENGVPVSLDCALTLGAGLCAGLHYAHEKAGPDGKPLNVVHRDVSPSNVLVSYDGAVKLVDFGIARAGSQPATTRGGLKGKIAYMSPEQCRGKTALDRRSDIFSVGSILYELTTGQLPFSDETEYGILNQIVNNDVPPPSTIVPGYPPALEAILMRALARDPEQRFATALELQGQLEDFAHENRLRVSPLVLARLMSSMFPQRLEEWDHARAQGAFFVEQHVVRTLIESGRTSDGSMTPPPADAPAPPPSPPPDDETTDVVALRPMDTQVGPAPAPDPTSPSVPLGQPVRGAPSGFEPPLSETLAGPPVMPHRPSPMPLPAPRPTPPPSELQAAAARMHPPTPGTLVSNSSRESAPHIEISYEPTERVSVPRDDTAMVRAPRSKKLPIILGLGIGGIGIAIALLVAGGGGKKGGETSAASKTPSEEVAPTKAEAPPETEPAAAQPDPDPAAEPVTKEEPAAVKAEPPAPIEKKKAPAVVKQPAVTKPPVVVKPPAVAKAPPKRPVAPPPAKKPEPKKEPAWNAESPFMPVRTDKK